jgi:hypothetical protein
MPSVYIKTYGCQMNERDSEAVAAQLAAKGYSLAANESGGGCDFAQYVQRARHGGAKGHRQNALGRRASPAASAQGGAGLAGVHGAKPGRAVAGSIAGRGLW